MKTLSWMRVVSIAVIAAMPLEGWVSGASAEPAKKVPRKSQPVSPKHAAPDVTATIPAPKPPAVDDEALPPPFTLPSAPRSRVRACGEKWQTIKMVGDAGNQTWREFATECLGKTGDPKAGSPQASR